MAEKQSIRWGIITTGLISQWFVADLMIPRPDAKVNHIIQSIGTSSMQKAKDFAEKFCPDQSPKLYDSYEGVYKDPEVDVVYIGTPHAFHKKNCLDAIAEGKNVFCEKAFTITKKEAEDVFAAAKEKGVYVAEAMWLRHRPMVHKLRELLYEGKLIGDVVRTFCDFGLGVDIPNLPDTSRYKNIKLGAGTVLDIGIYALTWALLTLDPGIFKDPETPDIKAFQSFQEGVEVTSSILLHFPSSGRQGIVTSTTMANGPKNALARIEGTNGYVEVYGVAPSHPSSFTVFPKLKRTPGSMAIETEEGKEYTFPKVGQGFTHEADNCAIDILSGRKESDIMPAAESIRVMGIMDEIRRQGGTRYPADDEA